MTKTTQATWCILLIALPALLHPPSTYVAFAGTDNQSRRDSKRRKRRHLHQSRVSLSSATTKLQVESNTDALRERWVDILSLQQYSPATSIRLENLDEQRYYYEAEILADKLLGLDTKSALQKQNNSSSLLSKELSIIWKSIVVASGCILITLPLLAIVSNILTSNFIQSSISTISSSITPYVLPTKTLITASIQNYKLQFQAIYHSLPYFLTHLNRIKFDPLPFIWKLMKKCIILECWRHVWLRVYKLTRYLYRGTLKNAKSVYVKVMPGWIRRGVKSMFQSMVQSQVHGVVGGVVGSVLSDVSFEGGIFGSGRSGSSGRDVVVDTTRSSLLDSTSVDISDAISDSAAQGLESTVQDALSESVGSAVEEVLVDTIAGSFIVESMAESVGDAVVESMAENVDAAVESMAESVESSIGDVVESFVDDCLAEGCVDDVVESIME